jgi:hypothetical protein
MTTLSTSQLKDPIVEILMLAARRGFEVMRQQHEAEMNKAANESEDEISKTKDSHNQHAAPKVMYMHRNA